MKSTSDNIWQSVKLAAGEQRTVVLEQSVEECGIEVADNAKLSLLHSVVGESNVVVKLGRDARAKVVFGAVEGNESNVHYTIELAGSGAELEMYGFFVAPEGDRRSVKIDVRHLVADCHSTESVKGIASGNGYGRFEGLVYVAEDAQRTTAYQQSRNIVVGDRSRIETLPQLEIHADDVKCSHGATVGQNDEEALYYMRQRGLSLSDARRLQMQGFVADIVMHIDDSRFAERLGRRAEQLIDTM